MAHHPSPLVFIDAAVSHYPQLVAELGKTALVRVLPADKDGIAVITACVRQYSLTRHIVIVAHGAPGKLTWATAAWG
ncbi:MAG: DUF4347 domain-containing protein [Leptolyngbyaceae cyanobacterium SM2_5_2]|nr:DUF4347 domain-containing protein [Leptolyngbyaceae cyanobacterium SM2_5_2]